MVTDPIVFRDLAYVFVAAVLGGALARLAGQPLILGYVLGGILISPLTPGPSVSDVRTFQLFAEVGVVLLMFSIGIEFSLRDLLRVKWVALIGGPLGILLSVGLGVGAGALLGWPYLQGMIVGIVVSVASTMVLARLLMDSGELHSRHGRIIIGISLVEDLAVVVLIVLIPAFGALEPGRLLTIACGPRQGRARPGALCLSGGQGRTAGHDAGGADPERRAVPPGRPRHRARHGGADPGGGAVPGAGGLPGRPAHQRVRLRARDARARPARPGRLRGALLRHHRCAHRSGVDHGEPAAARHHDRPRRGGQARAADARGVGCSASRSAPP